MMKLIFQYLLLSASLSLLFGACENAFVTEVDIDLGQFESELSVEARIVQGDTSVVYLTRTISITSREGIQTVPGAHITLLKNGVEIASFSESGSISNLCRSCNGGDTLSIYKAIIPSSAFISGEIFELHILLPDGSSASTVEKVPNQVAFVGLSAKEEEYGDKRLTLNFTDKPGKNYFHITGQGKTFYVKRNSNSQDLEFDSTLQAYRFSTGEDIDYISYGRRYIGNDDAFGGAQGVLILRGDGSYRSDCVEDCDEWPTNKAIIHVQAINSLGANYYEAFRQAIDAEDNPFIEPVIVPDGIEGGKGAMIILLSAQTITAEVTP